MSFNEKDHTAFRNIAKALFNKPFAEIKNALAEIEMEKGEEYRKEIEFELNLFKREQTYTNEAIKFYEDDKNVGKLPADYEYFPVIRQDIFKKVGWKREKEIKEIVLSLKKNQVIIEKLLRFRIQKALQRKKGAKIISHLIPKDNSIKNITT